MRTRERSGYVVSDEAPITRVVDTPGDQSVAGIVWVCKFFRILRSSLPYICTLLFAQGVQGGRGLQGGLLGASHRIFVRCTGSRDHTDRVELLLALKNTA